MRVAKQNYAILVPTKTLINEASGKIIDDLKDLLSENDYKTPEAITVKE